jgi:pre-mRNA-processing factor 19
MYCCLTGVVPDEPVVSRLNGTLYERRVIEKYIDQHHRDPNTKEPLAKDDLIPVRSGAANGPRAVTAATIPGLLAQLHSEWDAVMLEQFGLRQQLAAAQQELSHALYKHDAACRVITKLIVERDEARRAAGIPVDSDKATTRLDSDMGSMRDARDDVASSGLPANVCAEIDKQAERLRAARKKREVAREVPKPADLGNYVEVADLSPSHTMTTGTATGISCVAVLETNGMQAVFSGGNDGKAICYDVQRQAPVATLIGHQGAIHDMEAALDFVVTASEDSTTRVWRSEVGNYRCVMTLKGHRGSVNGLALLPTHRHVLTGGSDGLLQLQDMEAGVVVGTGRDHSAALGIGVVALHPDGFMCATGTAGSVHLWDVRGMEVDVGLGLPHNAGNVTSVAFSENGYLMALGGSMGVVQIYDLRHGTEAALDTIVMDDISTTRPVPVSEVAFDPSGQYLAVAAGTVKVLHARDTTANVVATFQAHLQPATCVAWGGNARYLVSGSHDRHVKIWGR